MKKVLHKFILTSFVLISVAIKGYSATYDWVGTTATLGVYNWNTPANWQIGGVTATTKPGSADIVRIAYNSFSNNPTVTDAESCASIVFGTYDNFTLTVNGALTVSGNITQNNDPVFYQYTILAGTGTITCGSFTLGDNTQPLSGIGAVNNVSCQVSQMTINGNLTLNAVGNSSGNGIEYPFFSLDANKITLLGQIVSTTYSNPLSGGVGDPNYPGLGLFQMDTGTSATTLELQNISPVLTPITSGFTIDFTNNGTGIGTVIYDATSGSQTVYTTGTSGLGINNYNYDYLTFSGASSKVVIGGALTIGNDWTTGGTGSVNLSTNNPTITVTGNLVNSTSITQGSGNIAVSNNLQNNSGTITLGSGTLTVTNALQINAGTITGGAGAITVSGTFQNNTGTFTCGAGNVTFKGNYTNSSVFTAGTGTVYFSGASQTLLDNGSTGTTFNKVTFNCTGTATMSAGTGNFSVSSTGVLTMVSPAKLVAGSATTAYLTLKTAATSSATIAAISGTSTITGTVNVQRYLTGGSSTYRGYRLLSSPVYASTVNSNNVYSINYTKNACYVTGSGGTTGGFDKLGNPTIYLYRENIAPTNSYTLGNFRGLNNITTTPGYTLDNEVGTFNIPAGSGFLFFFRGNRSTTLASKTTSPYATPENTSLTTTGTLNQGQITVRDWYTPASANLGYTTTAGNTAVRGYNLVGNPYASSIDWDLFNTTTTTSGIYGSSVGATIYVLDPVSKNYGAYVSGSGGIGTHNTTNILPSGQGFFVVATSSTAKLIFNESAKVNTQVSGVNLLMGKPADYITNLQYFHLSLAKDSVNTDDILIHFRDGASTDYTPQTEAVYNPGFGVVSLSSITSDNVKLAINVRPFPKKSDEIPLSVNAATSGTYQLNMQNIVGIPKFFDVWLIDNLTQTSVNMRENPVYSFQIDKSDSTTFGKNRFRLSLTQNQSYAYKLVDFTAYKVPNASIKQVQIAWKSTNEGNYTNFTIERSTDGHNFEVLNWKHSDMQGNYGILDNSPQPGISFYRLKQEDISGNITYSPVAMVEYANQSGRLTNNNINIYPNPARSTINLSISSAVASSSSYKIRITSSTGLLVREINLAQTYWQGNVSDLLNGTYIVQVINAKDQSLVGQSKFVKL